MRTSFPKSMIRIVLLEGVHPYGAELLREEGFDVDCIDRSLEGDALARSIADAHIVGIRSKTELTKNVLESCRRLLTVGCFCIGTNQVALEAACNRGVPVFNSPFSNTRSVAEVTIAEVIALHRRLFDKSTQMHAGTWDKSAAGAHEVRSRTLGIVGYGHIGSQVSVLAEALGMRVIYHDIIPKLPLGNARQVKSLDELLETSDVVTVHVPATPVTRRMISAAQIARMKPGTVLVNNARGGVVDVDDAAAALREGHLGGAAFDVFPEEPSGKGAGFSSALQGVNNVILTPHIGGSTIEAQHNIAEDVATKLIRFINNGSTTGAVNVPEVELPEQVATTEDTGRTRPHRILHFHRNVPGVLGRINGAAADLGANITGEYLRTNEHIGFVVLDVAPTDGEPLLERLREIPETIRVRMLW